jgi:acyl dehydratase/putative sterol carrier protein
LQSQGGSIINTTSYSGMIGNFGQSNYAAAKAGIYGLTRVLALELRKSGIRVNAIAPVAKTRMTEDISMVEADWTPEQISPIVVYLASDLGKGVTGSVFGVQGQRLHLYEVKTNDGVEKPGADPWTPAEIAERFADITQWDAAPAAPPAADDVVSAVFAHFPAGFRPEAAKGWTAVVHWAVKGGASQTIQVADGVATTKPGLHGSPTCTVKVDRDTLVSMLKGELDPQKAFMSGKAAADNMGDLIKLATAFDLKKIAASYAGGAAPAAKAAPAPAAAPTPAEAKGPPLGKRYDGGWAFVDRAETLAYAEATDDGNAAYRGANAVAPPMFHVRPILAVMMKAATDPELGLDLLRLVHGEHAMRFHRLLRHGDILDLRGELRSIEEKSSGRVANFGLYGFVDGKLAMEGTTTYFVRGKKRPDDKKEAPAAPVEPPPPPDLEIVQVVTDDQALRYATVSGDNNPIHTDEAVARSAGLPRTILHGLCTMAFAQRDLVDHLAGGDPGRLRALAVRFARPVVPGDTRTLRVWGRSGDVAFETRNAAGEVVIANGRASIG